MGNADFYARRPVGGRKGWWDWKPSQHALHYLWMTGAVTVHSRRHFHKRFDLMERAFPDADDNDVVSSEAFTRWHLERSLRALGAATDADLGRYLSFPRLLPGARRAVLRSMIERGEIAEIAVEESPGRWLALARDLPALARAERRRSTSRGTTLLTPFDSLLWHPERVTRLFGFDYRIEVYTPGPQRVHGYYTLPLLHHGQLIGRLDAKAHRAERRLEVRHVHVEPWLAAGQAPPTGGARLEPDAALQGVADALRSLATFVVGDDITLRRVTP